MFNVGIFINNTDYMKSHICEYIIIDVYIIYNNLELRLALETKS